MRKLFTLLILIFLVGCEEASNTTSVIDTDFVFLNVTNTYRAGDVIQLSFAHRGPTAAMLVLKNALGTTLVQPSYRNEIVLFDIPSSFSETAGICNWKLMHNQTIIKQGRLEIKANKLETMVTAYLGPRSIMAGEVDYTMMVVSPTDKFDNPLSNDTEVSIKNQFENTIQEETLKVSNLIAWNKVYSPTKSGRMLISASCNEVSSKELISIVHPNLAEDFTINFKRNHGYADGNQMVTFSTTRIYDKYNNQISDGTLVSFFVKNDSGMLLKTMGTTINGIAKAQLLHPTAADTWHVTAYITGIAQSNSISLDFERAVLNFDVVLSDDNSTITIGPIHSFMNQIIPDGMPVKLLITDEQDQLLDVKETTSRLGLASFTLSPISYQDKTYTITVEAGGITKKTPIVIK